MAATYTEVTLEDMEKFLKRAFRALRPKKGTERGELYYDLNLSDDNIVIRVWTSIPAHGTSGARKGEDAIRVTLITSRGKPLMPKGKIVKRTQNWRNSLQDRIEELHELYESKAEYWKSRRVQRDEDQEKRRRDDGEEPEKPEAPSPPPPPASGMHRGVFVSDNRGGWSAKITTEAQPGDKAMLETKGGRKVPVTLVHRTWSGADKYNNFAYSEIWTIENTRRASEALEGEVTDMAMAERIAARYTDRG